MSKFYFVALSPIFSSEMIYLDPRTCNHELRKAYHHPQASCEFSNTAVFRMQTEKNSFQPVPGSKFANDTSKRIKISGETT